MAGKIAMGKLNPYSDGLFIEKGIYDYGILDEFSICAFNSGHPDEAREACLRLLSEKKVPEFYIPRIQGNLSMIPNSIKKTKKNVISYLYLSNPLNIEESLGINLKFMREYYHIFDGIKIIYVATDIDLDENLKNQLSSQIGHPIKKFVRNNPSTRESEYFMEQLTSLKSEINIESITFYHHSKGSTYNNPNVDKWTSSMYYFNLCDDNIKIIEENLQNDYIFAGIFRVDSPSPPWVYSDWHFSGTFFWFSSKLFDIEGWENNNIDRFSTESYPGNKISIDKSFNIDGISNRGCDLRYTYYWRDIFPNIIEKSKFDDFSSKMIDIDKENYKKDISEKESAWEGHFDFAINLIRSIKPRTTVDLGVDWGFSMFSFAYPKIGEIYGIDWFKGDQHTGNRNTKQHVMELESSLKNKYGIDVHIIESDFTDASKTWRKEIDILHIDGLHTYEAVSSDFSSWSKFLNPSSVVLFHDVEVFEGVYRFFSELNGLKLIKSGSCGLGIWTLDGEVYEKIRTLI